MSHKIANSTGGNSSTAPNTGSSGTSNKVSWLGQFMGQSRLNFEPEILHLVFKGVAYDMVEQTEIIAGVL